MRAQFREIGATAPRDFLHAAFGIHPNGDHKSIPRPATGVIWVILDDHGAAERPVFFNNIVRFIFAFDCWITGHSPKSCQISARLYARYVFCRKISQMQLIALELQVYSANVDRNEFKHHIHIRKWNMIPTFDA